MDIVNGRFKRRVRKKYQDRSKLYRVLSENDFNPFPDYRTFNTNIEPRYLNEFRIFCNEYFKLLNDEGYYDENIYYIR